MISEMVLTIYFVVGLYTFWFVNKVLYKAEEENVREEFLSWRTYYAAMFWPGFWFGYVLRYFNEE